MAQPNLLQSLIGYEPVIDRKRSVIALRVQLRAASGQAQDMSSLYQELSQDWPVSSHTILMSASGAALDAGLADVQPNANVWLEVPAEATVVPEVQAILGELSRKGFPLVLRGRTPAPLPASLLPAFKMSIIHVNDDRRLNGLVAQGG